MEQTDLKTAVEAVNKAKRENKKNDVKPDFDKDLFTVANSLNGAFGSTSSKLYKGDDRGI